MARSPLHTLQYPVLYLSRMQRICLTRYLNLRSVWTEHLFIGVQGPNHVMILEQPEDYPILIHYNNESETEITVFSSMDSGLEAFSRNPAHGSV